MGGGGQNLSSRICRPREDGCIFQRVERDLFWKLEIPRGVCMGVRVRVRVRVSMGRLLLASRQRGRRRRGRGGLAVELRGLVVAAGALVVRDADDGYGDAGAVDEGEALSEEDDGDDCDADAFESVRDRVADGGYLGERREGKL